MASLNIGKKESVEWVKANFERGSSCLDVGVCDGKWSDLLRDYLRMDGVEIFGQNIIRHRLFAKYDHIYHEDIRRFDWTGRFYDLIIFGDVLEHMSVEEAQEVLKQAQMVSRDFLVAVPYEWENKSHYGNPYEIHIQDDLTPENVLTRYPCLKPLFIYERYGYYTKRGKSK